MRRLTFAVAIALSALALFLLRDRDRGEELVRRPTATSDAVREQGVELVDVEEQAIFQRSTPVATDGVETEVPSNDESASVEGDRTTPGGILVRVRSPAGLPLAGVPVRLTVRIARGKDLECATAITEAPAGEVRLGLDVLRGAMRLCDDLSIVPEIRVEADIACIPRPQVDLETPVAPGTVVDLTLPSTGAVVVRVLDENGSPFLGEAEVTLRAVGRSNRAATASAQDLAAERGVARFDHVGVGVDVAVDAGVDGRALAETTARGPVGPGDVCSVDVQLGPPYPAIRMRLVDERGEPLASSEVTLNALFDGPGSSWTARTDADGRYEAFWPFAGTAEEVEVVQSAASNGFEARSIKATIGRDPAPGAVIDLGDLAFPPFAPSESDAGDEGRREPRGGLALDLRLPDRTPFLQLELLLTSDKGRVVRDRCFPPSVGEVAFKDLEPGTWSFALVPVGTSAALASVDLLTVRAGETARDPRLLPLDLTTKIRPVLLSLVESDGAPLADTPVSIELAGLAEKLSERADDDGLVDLVVPDDVSSVVRELQDGRRVAVPLLDESPRIRVEF
ncbi:MAG: hypothetical protein AAF726_10695 [Planctomycetota bacterium]